MVLENGVHRYLGIPYADAPVGPRRWQPPSPPLPWRGTRDALAYGASAPQASNRGPFDPVGTTAEDCLFLNVWTPAPDAGKRPVLVWIHGGGLRGGSGSEAATDGAAFAAHGDCVVVSCNYRLGALGGFIDLASLEGAGGARMRDSANTGLLDQQLALEWVRVNVASFGGDAGRVTVAGQSSGGQSVAMHMAVVSSRGLFQQAIVQSPAPTTLPERDVSAHLARRFVAHLEACGVTPDAIADAPVKALIRAQATLKKETDWGPIGHPLNPILDGAVLSVQPLQQIRATEAVPLIVGSTRDELVQKFGPDQTAIVDRVELAAAWAAAFPGSSPTGELLAERMAAAYCGERLRSLQPRAGSPISLVQADKTVRIGAIRLAEAAAVSQERVFAYLFEWDAPGGMGAPHCVDLPFVFGTAATSVLGALTGHGEAVLAMTAIVQCAWIAFVREGTPVHAELPLWPTYAPGRRHTLLLGPSPRVERDPWSLQRLAWEGV